MVQSSAFKFMGAQFYERSSFMREGATRPGGASARSSTGMKSKLLRTRAEPEEPHPEGR